MFTGAQELSVQEWRREVISTLSQFSLLWSYLYRADQEGYRDPLLIEAKNIFSLTGAQALFLATHAPRNTDSEDVTRLIEVASKLTHLGNTPFHFNSYKELGNELVGMTSEVMEKVRRGVGELESINLESGESKALANDGSEDSLPSSLRKPEDPD